MECDIPSKEDVVFLAVTCQLLPVVFGVLLVKIISPLLSGSRNPPLTICVPLGQVAVKLLTTPPAATVAVLVTTE
jgi:hypothetical protein